MEKLDPTKDGRTPDVIADNIEKLRELFPEAFTEGSDDNGPRWKVDFDVLKEVIGEYGEKETERYSFTWNGKSRARLIAQTPSTGTLRPCPEESVNWDTTKNLFIEGDNLEVLKLLQKSYHKKVKMIYIDPPYNTGNDFIYPDKFADNLDTYLRYTGQINDEGFKVSTNAETGGRYHTNWLNMMYPRLKLARNLLRDDGAFFASCDEVEQPRLRLILDEVFGEENFVADLVWAAGRKNDSRFVSISHEYILCYARDKSFLTEKKIEWRQKKKGLDEIYARYSEIRNKLGSDYKSMTKEMKKWFKSLPDGHPAKAHKHYCHVDARGLFFPDNISWPGGGGPKYEVLHPKTGQPVTIPSRGWMTSDPKKMQAWIEDDRVHFGEDESAVPCIKSYLTDREYQPPYSVFYKDGRAATKRLRTLMGAKVFDFPKDETILQELVEMITSGTDIVMDFFAGSATCAHAVIAQNKTDGNDRRYIMVQLPEPLEPTNERQRDAVAFCDRLKVSRNIAELAKERIRRAIQIFDSVGKNDGVKVLKLDSSNIKPWDADFDNVEQALLDSVDNIKPDRSEDDVLYELLLKYGLDLAVPIETRIVDGSKVYVIGGGALIVCLADGIDAKLAEGIVEIRDEIQPEIIRVVFKDSGFKSDVAKTNVMQVLKQAGIEDVKSL